MKRIILLVAFAVMIPNAKIFAHQKYASISGSLAQIANGDSVIISVNKYGYAFSEPLLEMSVYKSEIVNHHFSFKITVSDSPLYLEIQFGNHHKIRPLNGYIIESGDNVFIKADQSTFTFVGKGSEKFTTIYELDRIKEKDFIGIGEDRLHPNGMANICKKTNLTGRHQMSFLNTKKALISPTAFTLIKAQILGLFNGEVSSSYYWDWSGTKDSLKNVALSAIKNYKKKFPVEVGVDHQFNKNELLKYAGTYSCSLILKYQLDSCYLIQQPFSIEKCYKYIKKAYSGALRERIVTNLLYYYRVEGQDISGPLNNALTFVKNEDFISVLRKLQSSRIKGALAYNFTLTDTLGKIHQLSDYKGKVVLMDFWYTGCGNCIKIAPYLSHIERLFNGKPVVFLSINIDTKKDQWVKSVRSGKYNSNYVTNLYTGGMGSKHPICLNYDIDGCPTLILIDKSGKLMTNPTDPRVDNGRDILKLINSEI